MELAYRLLVFRINFKAWGVVKHEWWGGSRHIGGVDGNWWCALAKLAWKTQTYAIRLVRDVYL